MLDANKVGEISGCWCIVLFCWVMWRSYGIIASFLVWLKVWEKHFLCVGKTIGAADDNDDVFFRFKNYNINVRVKWINYIILLHNFIILLWKYYRTLNHTLKHFIVIWSNSNNRYMIYRLRECLHFNFFFNLKRIKV